MTKKMTLRTIGLTALPKSRLKLNQALLSGANKLGLKIVTQANTRVKNPKKTDHLVKLFK
jgi:hypothetical protein